MSVPSPCPTLDDRMSPDTGRMQGSSARVPDTRWAVRPTMAAASARSKSREMAGSRQPWRPPVARCRGALRRRADRLGSGVCPQRARPTRSGVAGLGAGAGSVVPPDGAAPGRSRAAANAAAIRGPVGEGQIRRASASACQPARSSERGWLSANNVLLFDGDEATLIDSGYVSHADQTVSWCAPRSIAAVSAASSTRTRIPTTSAATPACSAPSAAASRCPRAWRARSRSGTRRRCC